MTRACFEIAYGMAGRSYHLGALVHFADTALSERRDANAPVLCKGCGHQSPLCGLQRQCLRFHELQSFLQGGLGNLTVAGIIAVRSYDFSCSLKAEGKAVVRRNGCAIIRVYLLAEVGVERGSIRRVSPFCMLPHSFFTFRIFCYLLAVSQYMTSRCLGRG